MSSLVQVSFGTPCIPCTKRHYTLRLGHKLNIYIAMFYQRNNNSFNIKYDIV